MPACLTFSDSSCTAEDYNAGDGTISVANGVDLPPGVTLDSYSVVFTFAVAEFGDHTIELAYTTPDGLTVTSTLNFSYLNCVCTVGEWDIDEGEIIKYIIGQSAEE